MGVEIDPPFFINAAVIAVMSVGLFTDEKSHRFSAQG